jgi:hypothetical protein
MSHFSATQKKLPGLLGDVGGYCIYIYINQEKVSFASESTAISINQYISYTSQGWFHTFTGKPWFYHPNFWVSLEKTSRNRLTNSGHIYGDTATPKKNGKSHVLLFW